MVKDQDELNVPRDRFFSFLNIAVAVAMFFCSCFLLELLSSVPWLVVGAVLMNVLLALIYRNYRKKGSGKAAVNAVRIAAVLISATVLIMPAVHIGFSHTKALFGLKRYIFCDITHDSLSLPDFLDELPEVCEDYVFVTEPSLPAQDYRASMMLTFRTDAETLRMYDEKLSATPDTGFEIALNDDGEPEFPKEVPAFVVQKLGLDDGKYTYYKYGCCIDYDSGRVIFWT